MSAAKGGAAAPFGAACAALVSSAMDEWHGAKHRRASKEEIAFVNSIPVERCPYCGCAGFVRDGKGGGGVLVFRCKARERRFGALTGTLFDSHKIPVSEWVEFAIHLMEYHSVRTSSSDNRNAETTGECWVSKVFEALRGYQVGLVLSGEVFFGEACVSVAKSERVAKKGIQLRGLSRNKICIACGTGKERCFAVVEGIGKPSNVGVWRAYVSGEI